MLGGAKSGRRLDIDRGRSGPGRHPVSSSNSRAAASTGDSPSSILPIGISQPHVPVIKRCRHSNSTWSVTVDNHSARLQVSCAPSGARDADHLAVRRPQLVCQANRRHRVAAVGRLSIPWLRPLSSSAVAGLSLVAASPPHDRSVMPNYDASPSCRQLGCSCTGPSVGTLLSTTAPLPVTHRGHRAKG